MDYKNAALKFVNVGMSVKDTTIVFHSPSAFKSFVNDSANSAKFLIDGSLTPSGVRLEKAAISRVGYDLLTDEFVCPSCSMSSKFLHHLVMLHDGDCATPLGAQITDRENWKFHPDNWVPSYSLMLAAPGIALAHTAQDILDSVEIFEATQNADKFTRTERDRTVYNSKTGGERIVRKKEKSVVWKRVDRANEFSWPEGDVLVEKIHWPAFEEESVISDGYQSKRKSVALSFRGPRINQARRVQADVNEVIIEVLELARETGIEVREVIKSGKSRFRVPLRHDVAFEDFLEDFEDLPESKLKTTLKSTGMDKVLYNGELIEQWKIEKGWSGTVITKYNIPSSQHKFIQWSSNGVCVVQGKWRNLVLNALEDNSHVWFEDEVELYSSKTPSMKLEDQYAGWMKDSVYERISERAMQADHVSDDKGQGMSVLEDIANFYSALTIMPHIHCNKCYTRFLDEPLIALVGRMQQSQGYTKLMASNTKVSGKLKQLLNSAMRVEPSSRTFVTWNSEISALDSRLAILDQHLSSVHDELSAVYNLVNQYGTANNVDGARMLSDMRRVIKNRAQNEIAPVINAVRDLDVRLGLRGKTEVNLWSKHAMPRHYTLDNVCNMGMELDFLKSMKNMKEMFGEIFQYLSAGVERDTFSSSLLYIHSDKKLMSATTGLYLLNTLEDVNKWMNYPEVEQSSGRACEITVRGKTRLRCCADDNGNSISIPSLPPLLHHLRLAYANSALTISIPDGVGKDVLIPREGYCYVSQILLMTSVLNETDMRRFCALAKAQIQTLGSWPKLKDVLVTFMKFVKAFPQVYETPPCVWVVDHNRKLIHIVSQLGVGESGLHQLYFKNVGELFDLVQAGLGGEMLDYQVGGLHKDIENLFSKLFKKEAFLDFFCDEKRLVKLLLSPSGVYGLTKLIDHHGFPSELFRDVNTTIALNKIQAISLEFQKASDGIEMIQTYIKVMKLNDAWISQLVGDESEEVRKRIQLLDQSMSELSKYHLMDSMDAIIEEEEKNEEALRAYIDTLLDAHRHSLHMQCIMWFSKQWKNFHLSGVKRLPWRGPQLSRWQRKTQMSMYRQLHQGLVDGWNSLYKPLSFARSCWFCLKTSLDLFLFRTSLWFYSVLLYCVIFIIAFSFITTVIRIKRFIVQQAKIQHQITSNMVERYLISTDDDLITVRRERGKTIFGENLDYTYIDTMKKRYKMDSDGDDPLHPQASGPEKVMTWWMAMFTLVLMLVSTDWGFAACSVLSKFKMLQSLIFTEGLKPQAKGSVVEDLLEALDDETNFMEINLEEITPDTGNKFAKNTIDMWLQSKMNDFEAANDPTTFGKFLKIEKMGMLNVVEEITKFRDSEFRVHGGVGCGKSTTLPSMICNYGHILLLEPSRALAKGVHESLRVVNGIDASLMFRGRVEVGKSPITVMTYGYALAYFVHNPGMFSKFKFIQMDEVHEYSSESIVFYNWLKNHADDKIIYKTSATHKGFETEFAPNYPVEIVEMQRKSPQEWAKLQGTGIVGDATQFGKCALVMVASYNDVDKCARELELKGKYSVIKVDRRTFRDAVNLTERVDEALSTGKFTFIVSTPITQTGVTLDIDSIVDFGEKIVPRISMEDRMLTTERVRINRSDRMQRLGRVGRKKPGKAFKVGSGVDGENEISEVVATEAAMLAFVHGIKPCLHNVNMDVVRGFTREQCTTASNFEVSILYMSHYVLSDGHMIGSVYNEFKALLLRDACVKTKLQMPITEKQDGWLTLAQYSRAGHMKDRECDSGLKIPFHTHEMSDAFVFKIAEALSEASRYKRNAQNSIRLPSVDAGETHYKLSVNDGAIANCLLAIDMSIKHFTEVQNNLNHGMAHVTGYSLLSIGHKRLNEARKRGIDTAQANLDKLYTARRVVEASSHVADNSELRRFLDENPLACALLHNQCMGLNPVDIVVERKETHSMIKKIIGLGCCAIVAYGIYRASQAKQLEILHEQARGNKRRIGRDRKLQEAGGPEYAYACNPEEMYEAFGPAYVKSRDRKKLADRLRKRVEKKDFSMNGVQNKRFIQLYDINMEDIEQLFLHDRDTNVIGVVEEGQDLINKAHELIKRANREQRNGMEYGKNVDAYIAMKAKDGKYEGGIRKVVLTPHSPNAINRMNHLPVGFPDKAGVLRQTGEMEIIPVEQFLALMEDVEIEELAPQARSGIPTLDELSMFTGSMVQLSVQDAQIGGFVHGNKLIVNAHFESVANSVKDCPMTLYTSRGCFTLKSMKGVKITELYHRDLVIIHLPFDMQPFRKCKNFRRPIQNEAAVVLWLQRTVTGLRVQRSEVTRVHVSKKHEDLWVHYIPMTDGTCGSLVVSVKDCKVLGFHAYSSTSARLQKANVHYFIAIHDDLLSALENTADEGSIWTYSDCLADWNAKTQNFSALGDIWKAMHDIQAYLHPQGRGDMVLGQRLTMAEKYCGANLTIQGVYHDNMNDRHVIRGHRDEFSEFMSAHEMEELLGQMGPSLLTRESFYKDLLKYDEPVVVGEICEISFYNAIRNVTEYLERVGFMVGGCPFIWSSDEIYKDLNLDAATGALYGGKKREYLAQFSTDELHELFTDSITRLHSGKMGIWTGSLKAELRPIEKIKEGKTRVFTAAPIDVLLGAKAAVDSFNKQFYTTHTIGPWTVGINKFNRGWDRLARKFNHNWLFIDADGSRFDSSIAPIMFQAVCSIREYFMNADEDEAQILRNLYTQIIYTPVTTVDGFVIKKHKGNNSGQPSTVVDNTLILSIAVEYARVRVEERFGVKMQFTFVANGDDLLINAPPDEVSLIQAHFAIYMKELGLNYNFNDVHSSLESVWFLSHTFMLRDGVYIPKLEQQRIASILEWIKSTDADAVTSSFNAALVESFGYDDLTALLRKFIIQYCTKWGLESAKFLTDEQIESLYMDEDNKLLASQLSSFKIFSEYYMMEELEDLRPQSSAGSTPPLDPNLGVRTTEELVRPQDPPPFNQASGQDITTVESRPLVPMRVVRQQGNTLSNLSLFTAMKSNYGSISRHVPVQSLIDNSIATAQEVKMWTQHVAASYGVTEEQFNGQILPLFIWNCIDNGTSNERKSEDSWRATNAEALTNPNANVEDVVVLYDMKPIFERLPKSLRRVMRMYSPIAMHLIKNANSNGGTYIPKTAISAGMTDPQYAHVCYDFCVEKNLTKSEQEVRNNVLAANLRGKADRTFVLAESGAGETSVIDRYTTDDVARGRHNYGGAHLS